MCLINLGQQLLISSFLSQSYFFFRHLNNFTFMLCILQIRVLPVWESNSNMSDKIIYSIICLCKCILLRIVKKIINVIYSPVNICNIHKKKLYQLVISNLFRLNWMGRIIRSGVDYNYESKPSPTMSMKTPN
jgi:hypothetical protein